MNQSSCSVTLRNELGSKFLPNNLEAAMPRQGVTYSDVESAIDALNKAGLTPSIRLIREQIGAGSLSTIAEHKRAFDAKQAAGPGPALPDRLTKGLMEGAQGLWQELVDAAEGQIGAIQTHANEQIEELKQRLAQAQQELIADRETNGELRAALGDRDIEVEQLKQSLADRDQQLGEHAIVVSRMEAECSALTEQRSSLQVELDSTRSTLASAQAQTAQLTERLERQALESAKDKATLQKHFNEYKDRLVTMSDERREALEAQREAEKQAVAIEKRAAESINESSRLNKELADARDEVRFLTETLGELKGELSALQATSSEQLADRDGRIEALESALAQARSELREYVATDRSLVQSLIEERQSARA